MKPRSALIGALCGFGAALETLGDAWGAWLLAYEAAQEEAFTRGGFEAVRALTASMGLDLVTAGLRDRMSEVGLGPLVQQSGAGPAGKPETLTGRWADLQPAGSETIQ